MFERAVAVIASLGLVILVVVLLPYEAVVVGLTILSVVSSGYFVITWGYSIIRARLRSHTRVSALGMLDFAGLPLMVFIYTAMALVDISQHGVAPATDVSTYLRRVILYALLTMIAVMRTIRWVGYQRAGRGASVVPSSVRSASSEHTNAVEGRTNERNPAERR